MSVIKIDDSDDDEVIYGGKKRARKEVVGNDSKRKIRYSSPSPIVQRAKNNRGGKKVMELSCGVILQDIESRKILAIHNSRKKINTPCTYDLPKGRQEEGEDERDAAARELTEESGISLTSEQKGNMRDLGIYDYIANKKRLHLFYLEVDMPDLCLLHCESLDGEMPEIDGYALVSLDNLELYYKSMQETLKQVMLDHERMFFPSIHRCKK